MNYVQFSPDFPPNYYPFAIQLRRMGLTVLGVGEAPFDALRPELRYALNEYYRVTSLHNYDELVRALGYFTYRFGKIDRLESHNEYWLESDARLRSDFNIFGFQIHDLARIKRKSEMKSVFLKAGVPAARGRVSRTIGEALELIDEVGYPVIAKPDIGVGAARTYRISSRSELDAFFTNKPLADYIFEEYIEGAIETFDGLTDQDARIVFCSSMVYSEGVMDIVNQLDDFWYMVRREIPSDLESMGRKLVKAYSVRERFFHFEFFRTPGGGIVGLEVNMRPPGGLTTDMWNYANDIDIYREYASVVANNRFEARVERPYFCAYLGRRYQHAYAHPIREIESEFPLPSSLHNYWAERSAKR
ncbi:MAG TPA: hypothetical protein VF813_12000 [Anaerolineaceae bacterium]